MLLEISHILLFICRPRDSSLIRMPQMYFTFINLDDLDSSFCRGFYKKLLEVFVCFQSKNEVLKRTGRKALSGTVH